MRTVFSLGNDEGRRNRAIFAIACAVALNEIFVGILSYYALWAPPKPAPEHVIAQVVTLVRRHPNVPTPPPTPTPPPPPRVKPTPRIAVTTKTLVQARAAAAAPRTQRSGGAAAPLHQIIVAKRPAVVVPVTPAPVRVAVAANASMQNGKEAGIANGGTGIGGGAGAGSGGAGGTDSGTGGNGSDDGMDTPLSPCGHPTFTPTHRPIFRDGEYYVDVTIHVPLRDGEVVDDNLHWEWVYPSADADPWSDVSLQRDPNSPVYLQLPPAGFDLAGSQKPSTVLAVAHTRANGSTNLPDCPEQAQRRG